MLADGVEEPTRSVVPMQIGRPQVGLVSDSTETLRPDTLHLRTTSISSLPLGHRVHLGRFTDPSVTKSGPVYVNEFGTGARSPRGRRKEARREKTELKEMSVREGTPPCLPRLVGV